MKLRVILNLEADVAPGEATLEELTEAARESVSFTSPSQIGKIGCYSGRLFSRVHVEQAMEVTRSLHFVRMGSGQEKL